MSKYLDDLERENDELRALLREATFEVCFPYCSSQTEEKWSSPEKCGDCWAKKLVAALKKKRAPETILPVQLSKRRGVRTFSQYDDKSVARFGK